MAELAIGIATKCRLPRVKRYGDNCGTLRLTMPNVGLDTDFVRVQDTCDGKTKTSKKPQNRGREYRAVRLSR